MSRLNPIQKGAEMQQDYKSFSSNSGDDQHQDKKRKLIMSINEEWVKQCLKYQQCQLFNQYIYTLIEEKEKKVAEQDKQLNKRKQMERMGANSKKSCQSRQQNQEKKREGKYQGKQSKNQKHKHYRSDSSKSESEEENKRPVKKSEEDEIIQNHVHTLKKMLIEKWEEEDKPNIRKQKPTKRQIQLDKSFGENKHAKLKSFETKFEGTSKKVTLKIKLRLNFGFYDQIYSTLLTLLRDRDTKLIIQLARAKDAYKQVLKFITWCYEDTASKISKCGRKRDGAVYDQEIEGLDIQELKSDYDYFHKLKLDLLNSRETYLEEKRGFQVQGDYEDYAEEDDQLDETDHIDTRTGQGSRGSRR
ncbi:hypothetical protein OXYTRIMIC_433 [Oxytricha trifallax]|uniref:Uncharacterized protein n=1 Tax=Oxytricha trifallax TaxID=1172189 RepID=A0A073IB10_9SPIT|nr:hypothetical protein OXYTRIMIC_433 [Oxytricha trifallax]